MARKSNRPAEQVREAIRGIEEYPPSPGQPGIVRIMVGRVDDGGSFPSQQYETHLIEGEDYDRLCGDGAGWATPGKPNGTFRNDDLWHFVDRKREAARAAREGE